MRCRQSWPLEHKLYPELARLGGKGTGLLFPAAVGHWQPSEGGVCELSAAHTHSSQGMASRAGRGTFSIYSVFLTFFKVS